MNLDLTALTADWHCPDDEIGARVVRGIDGQEIVQLRVEMGVLQMFMDGRPDGARFRGMPSALDFIQHELALERTVSATDWQELVRELQQFNYRRLAFSTLADRAYEHEQHALARDYLNRDCRDIDACLTIADLLEESRAAGVTAQTALVATLLLNRARARAGLHLIERRFDEAIDELERGIACIDDALARAGIDPESRRKHGGIAILKQMEEQLRRDYGVGQTLRERLTAAIEREDFETAAQLRDELRRRGDSNPDDPPAAQA